MNRNDLQEETTWYYNQHGRYPGSFLVRHAHSAGRQWLIDARIREVQKGRRQE